MCVHVIKASPLFRILEGRVGLIELLHLARRPRLGLCIGLAVAIRVVLTASALVGQFDFLAPSVWTNAQNFVWIHV